DGRRGLTRSPALGRAMAPADAAASQLLLHARNAARSPRPHRLRGPAARTPRRPLSAALPRAQGAPRASRPAARGVAARRAGGPAEPVRYRDGRRAAVSLT